MSAQVASDESVGNWLDILRGYSAPLPEDHDKSLVGTAYERDVYLLAVIAQELFARDNGAAAFSLPAGIEEVLGKAAAPITADRFSNAVAFAAALGAVLFPPVPVVD